MPRIFVGNLSYDMVTADLREAFEAFGPVKDAKILNDRETGRSRGFGFVEMDSAEDAKAAIAALHETEVRGRSIVVNEARPREERGGGGAGGRGGNGGYGGGGYDREGGGRADRGDRDSRRRR